MQLTLQSQIQQVSRCVPACCCPQLCSAVERKEVEQETEVKREQHKEEQAKLAAQRKADAEAARKKAEEDAAAQKAADAKAAAEAAEAAAKEGDVEPHEVGLVPPQCVEHCLSAGRCILAAAALGRLPTGCCTALHRVRAVFVLSVCTYHTPCVGLESFVMCAQTVAVGGNTLNQPAHFEVEPFVQHQLILLLFASSLLQETDEERGRRIASQWTNDPAAAGTAVRAQQASTQPQAQQHAAQPQHAQTRTQQTAPAAHTTADSSSSRSDSQEYSKPGAEDAVPASSNIVQRAKTDSSDTGTSSGSQVKTDLASRAGGGFDAGQPSAAAAAGVVVAQRAYVLVWAVLLVGCAALGGRRLVARVQR